MTKGGRYTLDRHLPCRRSAADRAVRCLRGHAAATARAPPHPADRLLLPRRLGRVEQHRPAPARWVTTRAFPERVRRTVDGGAVRAVGGRPDRWLRIAGVEPATPRRLGAERTDLHERGDLLHPWL